MKVILCYAVPCKIRKEKNVANWDDLDYQTRLNAAEFIFMRITDMPACSFRRLIYDRLGFKEDAYYVLYEAGGMEITNAMVDWKGEEKR